MMNIFRLEIIENNYKGINWDIYYGFMIVAKNIIEARKIANGDFPEIFNNLGAGEQNHDLKTNKNIYNYKNNIWLNSKYTNIQKVGTASKGIKKGVLLSGYHAG